MRKLIIVYFGTYFGYLFFGLLLLTNSKLLNVNVNQIIYMMLIAITSLIYPLSIIHVYPYMKKRFKDKNGLRIAKLAYVVLVVASFVAFDALTKQFFPEDISSSMLLLILLPPALLFIGILSE
jgi:hypothetical protein